MGASHFLITLGRIIKTGLVNFIRNTWLGIAAIAVMVITLTIILFSIIANATFSNTVSQITDKIDISVIQSGKKITTEIKDNGKGFNPLKITENKDGIGLQNMKARIEMLKGKMRIDSAADRGTKVFIEIPIV